MTKEQLDTSKLYYINCAECGKPLGIYEGEDFDIVFNKRTIIKARIMCKKCSMLQTCIKGVETSV